MIRIRTVHVTRTFTAALLALGACGDPSASPDAAPGPDAAPTAVFDDVRTLQPSDLVEGAWLAGPQDRIVVQLTGTGGFGWNIHGHAGGDTTTVIEELDRTSASHDFSPPAQATWNLLIANRGTAAIDVTVHMELYGAATWQGWQ